MKEQIKNRQFLRPFFFLQICENHGYMPEPAFQFLRITIVNPKNRLDNLQGLFQCCPVIKFYIYPVDTSKDLFIFTKKDMYSQKNSIYYRNELHIYFLKINLPIMYMLVFNFQNMTHMHKRYAYQISNSIA
jgi:hypothetical protein